MCQIHIDCIAVGPVSANCYVVENRASKECFVVDPGAEAERIIRLIGDRKPRAVLLTHGHFDHIGAVDDICAHYRIPLIMHRADAPKLADARLNVSALFGQPMTLETRAEKELEGGEMLEVAGIRMEVLHTPGHSAGSVCYVLPEAACVLTGDTLFAHGYGRTDFEDGDFMQLRMSLRELFHLTPRMTTYPGHDLPGVTGRDPVEEG